MDKDRIVSGTIKSEDLENEISLRPRWIHEYIGQDKAKEKLKFLLKLQKVGKSHWIMFYFMDHQV